MLHQGCLVIVEVRFRNANQLVSARQSVDSHKQRKIIKTAAIYLAKNPGYASHPMRFDVVAVEGDAVEWIRDAFRPAGAWL